MPSEDEKPSGPGPETQKSFKRACDCCRKRKVRCDGVDPCGPCKKASIRCAYLQPPRKKGPKGLRSARVLHALRRIDEATPTVPLTPLSPSLPHQDSSYWSWASNEESSPPAARPAMPKYEPAPYPIGLHQYTAFTEPQYGQTIMAPTSHHTTATSHYTPVESTFAHDWPSRTLSPSSNASLGQSSPVIGPAISRLPSHMFQPYISLFFNHIYPIMPIIDRHVYLNHDLYNANSCLTNETYAFLCALSAATIVQLDAAAQPPPFVAPPGMPHTDRPAELLVHECLRERQNFDYIEHPTTLTVMTSFFVFAYYGNNERHEKAWHYLQEAISFAQVLDLDDEHAILKLDPVEAQWRRRLYWLLFVTERAYAIQQRKQTRLHASIQLPLVFESENPKLLNGFVTLVHLFSAIDDNFVRVWRGTRRRSLCSAPWLADTQRSLDGVALAVNDITETQQLDISVSREWLHVLAWQMGVSNGLIWGKSGEVGASAGGCGMRLDYPVELARRVVKITEGANSLALDSHGIGMEQKLSDIAGCLADVLKCSAGDMSDTFTNGRQYLHLLLSKLSLMRGKESRYLRPLMSKMDDLMGYQMPPELPPPTQAYECAGAGVDVNILGALPGISIGRGVAGGGKVYDEEQTHAMAAWAR